MPTINQPNRDMVAGFINHREYHRVNSVNHPIQHGARYRYWFQSYTGKPVFARNLKDLTRRIGQDVIDQQKAGERINQPESKEENHVTS